MVSRRGSQRNDEIYSILMSGGLCLRFFVKIIRHEAKALTSLTARHTNDGRFEIPVDIAGPPSSNSLVSRVAAKTTHYS